MCIFLWEVSWTRLHMIVVAFELLQHLTLVNTGQGCLSEAGQFCELKSTELLFWSWPVCSWTGLLVKSSVQLGDGGASL